jgi:hypothetical protein
MIAGFFDHLQRQDHLAPRVVAAHDRQHHPTVDADVLKAAIKAGADVEMSPFFSATSDSSF